MKRGQGWRRELRCGRILLRTARKALALLGLLGFVGAAAAAAEKAVALEWWPIGERATAEKMVQIFEGKHPNIKINIFFPTGGWEDRWEKLNVTSAGGVGPDVVRTKEYWIPELAVKGMIRPIDDFLKRDWNEIKPEPHYYQMLLRNNNSYQGQIYGLPAHNFWPMLHYNQRLFDDGGILGPPKTWDEFRVLARKLTKDKNGDGNPDVFGTNLYTYDRLEPTAILWSFLLYALPRGGEMLRWQDNRPAYTFNTPENLDALKFNIENMYGFGIQAKPKDPSDPNKEQVAMWFTGQFGWGGMDRSYQIPWKVALVPEARSRMTFTEGNSYLMLASTKHPAEAWEFMKFLNSREGDLLWSESAGTMPFREEDWKVGRYAKEERYLLSRQQVLENPVLFPRYHLGWTPVLTEVAREFRKAYYGEQSPEVTLQQADAAAKRELERYGR